MAKKLNDTQLALLTARTAISKKSTWARGMLATNKDGQWRPVDDNEACAWCAIGAIEAFVPEKLKLRTYRALRDAVDYLYPDKDMAVSQVNDNKGHKKILEVFDTAFQMAGD